MTVLNIDINLLKQLSKKPTYGSMGDSLWTDPYISEQMLKYHLDQSCDAASRRKDTIEKSVLWLTRQLGLESNDTLLDLGCGPGLYAEEFSRQGLKVTGVDYSQNSINYARTSAKEAGLDIDYLCGNYLEAEYGQGFDAAVIIYYDLGVLFPEDRDLFLGKVHAALKPGGYFAFDVLAPLYRSTASKDWHACSGHGFYRPDSYLVLTESFHYPEEQAWLDQHMICSADGLSVIRTWDHYYTPDGITAVLQGAGFSVLELREDLMGTECSQHSTTLAVLAQKK